MITSKLMALEKIQKGDYDGTIYLHNGKYIVCNGCLLPGRGIVIIRDVDSIGGTKVKGGAGDIILEITDIAAVLFREVVR